ncbi:MAG: glucosaminidase domain-containing protein [Chitinophagaceae bacterium]
MQKIKNLIVVVFAFVAINAAAQKQEKVLEYIGLYKDLAIAEMQRTGVPASITLAQGIHESGAGGSKLAMASNNHFGIKCKSNWTGESVKHDDDAKGECFRKYLSSEDSYKDHSDFLKNGQRYAFLFSLDPADYQGWANGLKKAGYATNPKYPHVLIKLVEDYQLQDYSLIALGKLPVSNEESEIVKDEVKIKIADNKTVEEIESGKAEIKSFPAYPEGEFKINETKVLFVKEGTSFLSVAKQYGLDLYRLFEFNDMQSAIEVEKDQLIYIQRKRKTGNADFHVVQVGETLQDIAQSQAIRLESLQELNWLKKNDIPAVGEKLSLKSKSTSMPKLALKEKYSITSGNKIK